MVGIAFGLVWVGYTAGLYGYCLLRGYNVTPKQLLSPQWPPFKGKQQPTGPSGPQGGTGYGPGGKSGGGAGGGGGGSW